MMAKHPLDPIKKPLSKDEIAQALRYAIIAELDAINMYLQIAEAIEDEKIKEVFRDIAREEKTHFGEFLTVLKELDPELAEEIKKGEEEVAEIFEQD
ncbi:MAG: rubrerythrin [Thermoprotei archaeon]|nr:MAG: rubrerythrin [Thermoprotei archaeon]